MKYWIIGWVAAPLALGGCGQHQQAQTHASEPGAEVSRTYSGEGRVTAIKGDRVTISHGPISGIGWPAMTMTFIIPAGMAKGIGTGDEVRFSFRQDGSAYSLTALQKR